MVPQAAEAMSRVASERCHWAGEYFINEEEHGNASKRL
jgi:hypothetical protein